MKPIFCHAKVKVSETHNTQGWSFCDLNPGHAGAHSLHLNGERADFVVSAQLERIAKLEAVLHEARALLRLNPKASKLIKQMNEVLP